jgi:hypothetical protein
MRRIGTGCIETSPEGQEARRKAGCCQYRGQEDTVIVSIRSGTRCIGPFCRIHSGTRCIGPFCRYGVQSNPDRRKLGRWQTTARRTRIESRRHGLGKPGRNGQFGYQTYQ